MAPITGNHKQISPADALQRIFKEFHGGGRRQVRQVAMRTEGEKVEVSGLLMTDTVALHALRGYPKSNRLSVTEALPGPLPRRGEGPRAAGRLRQALPFIAIKLR